jgi:hypothetical protein
MSHASLEVQVGLFIMNDIYGFTHHASIVYTNMDDIFTLNFD